MGITPAIQEKLAADYTANMAPVYAEVLSRGMFSWQQMWNGQGEGDFNGCCTGPLVQKNTCAASLRSLCAATSPQYTRAMQYSFTPGRCSGDPGNLTSPDQDIANFLLVRGEYAWLGHGWLGCSRDYTVPEQFSWDFGEPTELCSETAPNSGVFTRDWTKASIQMDCECRSAGKNGGGGLPRPRFYRLRSHRLFSHPSPSTARLPPSAGNTWTPTITLK